MNLPKIGFDPIAHEVAQDLIADCVLFSEQLTPWEVSFIHSLEDRLNIPLNLTEAQMQKLHDILERISE